MAEAGRGRRGGLAALGWAPVAVSEALYTDRLRGTWMAQCIANWTGLRTEGCRQSEPFLTDADWGTVVCGGPLDFNTGGNPWGADDDTDIEYVYLHTLSNATRPGGIAATTLTGVEIRDAWVSHVNRSIWVSNARARALMSRGVVPPATGLGVANRDRLMIDAQLTTEFFGALSPGAPAKALMMADLPIRTTAAGHAAHAAQFHVALYALAPVVPPELTGRDRVVWLVERARAFLPESSKSADVIDVCLADYLANPDVNNWERTRDLVATRYQSQAAANGFVYRAWYESAVNLAGGVIALLYGEGDLSRTIQIGTLSGWDSDNGTATMAGLVGLMIGPDGVRAEFPGRTIHEGYWISRTRDNMPDYVPGPGNTEDTFTMMAQRMMPIVRRAVTEGGGLSWVDASLDGGARNMLVTAPAPRGSGVSHNPVIWADGASWNATRVRAGTPPTATASLIGSVSGGRGSIDPSMVCNAIEGRWDGVEEQDGAATYFTTTYAPGGGTVPLVLTLSYGTPVAARGLRLVEGEHFRDWQFGGWITSISIQAETTPGVWTPVHHTPSIVLDPLVPFETVDLSFAGVVEARAFRVTLGQGGGVAEGGTGTAFVTVAEIDALRPVPAGVIGVPPTYDVNGDGVIGVEDVVAVMRALSTGASGAENRDDLDADGSTTADGDGAAIERAVRVGERRGMVKGRQ